MYDQHMDVQATLPFFHPTSVVVVDDDPVFLESFKFLIGQDADCRLYANPKEAVTYLQDVSSLVTPSSSFFFPCSDGEGRRRFEPSDRFIAFSPSKIRDLMFNKRRFDMTSVVIVDYDMPEIDGVEFCRQIKDLPCKKVILTGKADEKVAVRAFNQGLIDRFIFKHSENVSEEIFSALGQLQQDYFRDITQRLVEALRIKTPEFIDNPDFSQFFHDLCRRESCVEYYFSADPQGVLLLNASGKMMFLLVRDTEFIRAHYEIATDNEAPTELLERLKSGLEQPWFPSPYEYYDPNIINWQNYLYPAERIGGDTGWYCSFIDDVESAFDPDGDLNSFSLFHRGATQ